MEQERLAMSQKERDRLKVLSQVSGGQIGQGEGAEQLGLSERQVRRLVGEFRRRGDRAVIHGLRGRPSNRRIPLVVEQKAVGLVRGRYADFGPTLAAEYLAEKHQIWVSRETLRQWMLRAGLCRRQHQRVYQLHLWRPRRSCPGELVQWDTCEHDWLEGRGEKLYLIAMLDDATSRLLARFVRHDSTEENLRLLGTYLEGHGRPLAFYTDKASLFETHRPQQRDEELQGKLPKTQIGRALEELGITWIAAHSPQAKGRIERCFETLQDHLVKGLRLAGVRTLEQANRYLEEQFLPFWNRRFTVEPATGTDAHRPLGREHNLAAILSQVESRVVAGDYTLRWEGIRYQIARAHIRAGLRGARVRVEKRLDGTVAVRFRDRYLTVSCCQARPPAPPQPPAEPPPTVQKRPAREWMRGFNLHHSPPLWKILRDEHGPGREAE